MLAEDMLVFMQNSMQTKPFCTINVCSIAISFDCMSSSLNLIELCVIV